MANKTILSFLTLALTLLVSCSDSTTGTEPDPNENEESGITTGTLEVNIITNGETPDEDGYTVILNGTQTESAESNDTISFSDVEEGNYDLELTGIAGNCTVDGSNPTKVSVTADKTTSVDVTVSCKLMLKDKIVFVSGRDGNYELYVMNSNGSDQRKLTTFSGADIYPAVSPDGTQIVYSTTADDDSYFNYHIMDADGTGDKALTSGSEGMTGHGAVPSWSPDGSKIAFVSDRSGNREIYVMDADGSNQINISKSDSVSGISPTAWSPDESKIVFASTRGTGTDSEIYVGNTDGTGLVQLTDNDANENFASWSPDGSKIAFSSDLSGDNEIYIMNEDGSGIVQITNSAGIDTYPAWSPDGSQLIFASDRTGNFEIHEINIDGSGSIVNLTANSAEDTVPHWSPVK